MWVVHTRMAELWLKQKKTPLTDKEQEELTHCLDANLNRAWKMAALENMSLMASMTEDTDWLHELCGRIDRM